MRQKMGGSRRGFTLVEIMVVVAIIAFLAAIAVPSWLRARKRSQAARVLEDLRLLDHATSQYAIDTNRASGFAPDFSDLQVYLKASTMLYNTGKDILGNDYGPFAVDVLPQVPASTKAALSDVADTVFWSPYY